MKCKRFFVGAKKSRKPQFFHTFFKILRKLDRNSEKNAYKVAHTLEEQNDTKRIVVAQKL